MPLLPRVRIVDPGLGQTALQPVQVLLEAERALAIGRDHFVDAVAEDETAVQHRYVSLRKRQILAIQVAQGVVGSHRDPFLEPARARPIGVHALSRRYSASAPSTWRATSLFRFGSR